MKKNFMGVAYYSKKLELKSKVCVESGFIVRALVFWSSVS